MNKLGIVIATYRRDDGKSPYYLERALDSIFNQTYQNFKIHLIGDKYENESELNHILTKYDSRLEFENLPYAKERDKYKDNKMVLWGYGGVNAMNHGIQKCLNEDISYVCHLDHDDYWTNEHLELINQCIDITMASVIYTKSYYMNGTIIPNVNSDELFLPSIPVPTQYIHSSLCVDFKRIPIFYRNAYEEIGIVNCTGDGDLMGRITSFIHEKNLVSYFVNKLTCYHDTEGYSLQ